MNSVDIDRELEIHTHGGRVCVSGDAGIDVSDPIYANTDNDTDLPTVSNDHDYMNSEDLGSKDHDYMNSEDLGPKDHDYMNSEDLGPKDHDYMNSEDIGSKDHYCINSEHLIDNQLFSDNISLKVESLSSTHSLGESVHPLRDERETPSKVSGDPMPTGVVQKRFVPKRKCSTLHRESEINIEVVDKVRFATCTCTL